MFEITLNDHDKLQSFKDAGKADRNGQYAFTFENRYLIYHYNTADATYYIALDMNTGRGSEVIHRRLGNFLKQTEFRALIPHILYSIKYNGDHRYLDKFVVNPVEVIDSIFRVILPQYDFAIREEQIKLSKDMYKGLTGKLVSVCEAEVGTGKSLAYLVASLVANHKKIGDYGKKYPVTISTSSIELQKAIVEKEIPRLSKMLQDFGLIDKPLVAVIRKGKEHYFCRHRYEDFMSTIKAHPEKYASLIKAFEENEFGTRAFDLDKINLRPSIKDKICVKGYCTGCKHKSSCKYRAYIDTITDSDDIDFQVTNHNLYLTSMKKHAEDGSSILKFSPNIIIDEAHKLKDAAVDVFGARLTEKEIPSFLNIIKHFEKAGVNTAYYGKCIAEAERLNGELFSLLSAKINAEDTDEEKGTMIELTSYEKSVILFLLEALAEISQKCRNVNGEVKSRYDMLKSKLESFLKTSNLNVWLEADENVILELCNTAKNLSAVLRDNIWNRDVSHILTSGTMSDGTDFSFFDKENGLHLINKTLIQHTLTASPFDYANHSRIYLPEGMPTPDNSDEEYLQTIADKIVETIAATNGHTAILFTSYKVLNAVYNLTQDALSKYELFQMTRKNNTVIDEFKKSKNGILFASGSMWEGVDCIGDCLSSVIIVRLPFPRRSASLEQKKEDCASLPEFIRTYALPEMLIKLRQGMGRLIRCESDTGLITILDSRAADSYYANKIDKVISKYPRVNSAEEIQSFFKEVKPAEYFE